MPRAPRATTKAGRPSRLSMLRKADKERFLQLLRNGTPMTFACRAIRMTPQTMANYKARAAQEEQPYAALKPST